MGVCQCPTQNFRLALRARHDWLVLLNFTRSFRPSFWLTLCTCHVRQVLLNFRRDSRFSMQNLHEWIRRRTSVPAPITVKWHRQQPWNLVSSNLNMIFHVIFDQNCFEISYIFPIFLVNCWDISYIILVRMRWEPWSPEPTFWGHL